MEKQKMTIHRALSELKLIDSRIENGVSNMRPCGTMQKNKKVNGFYEKEEFDKDAKSSYDSVVALIDRKNKIKTAIVKANAETTVTIADVTMTIASAISFKDVVGLKRGLIKSLNVALNSSKANIEKNNVVVDENALKLAQAALAKDNVKINEGDAIAVTKPYIDNNKYSLVDPLGIEKLIEELQKEVDDFEAEVDAVLSEINAITIIEV